MSATRRLGVALLTAGMVAGSLAVTTGSSVLGATPPCRVRNVSQDTTGSSLAAMVAVAVDGDRLTVRGTCVGGVVIETDLSISGVGRDPNLSGGGRHRVVEVRAASTVSIADLTIRDGAADRGGGLLNAGTLTVMRTRIRDNRAGARNDCGLVPNPTCDYRRSGRNGGGGIVNEGELTLVASRILHNEAGTGGGIFNRGTLTIRTSTVARNVASVWSVAVGGGLVNGGTLHIRRSTIAGNTVVSGEEFASGGGLFNSGPLTLRVSTVSRNVAYGSNGGEGGGVANGSVYYGESGSVVMDGTTVTRNEARSWRSRHQIGSGITTCPVRSCGGTGGVTVRSSIIAGNGGDCAGAFTSSGHNLIGVAVRFCRGFVDGARRDRVGTSRDPVDARLGPLANNGGHTDTHGLLPGSLAIGAAGRAPCATPTDQRGVPRPQGTRCDIGAFELR